MEDLVTIVASLLDDFYRRRIDKISTLKLKNALARKNPYLYKAVGAEKASDIVSDILSAYMSSSDEGIFGDAFFEPLAEKVGGGHVAETEGVDVIVEDDRVYKAFAVKSGTNVFNADSRKRQAGNFRSLASRVAKRRKMYDAIVGYGYGRKQTGLNSLGFREVAGQVFWEELTGDPDFYIKIIDAMGDKPQQHLAEYQKAFDAAINRFTKEFIDDFCFANGSINWGKIVKFNSGKVCKRLSVKPTSRTLDIGAELKLDIVAIFFEDEIIQNPDDVVYSTSVDDVVDIDKNGIIRVKDDAEPGSQVKIIVFSYGKSRTVTIRVKKQRKAR